MAVAHIDPDEVERFAIELRKVTDQASQQLRQLQILLGQLPDAWHDQHFSTFQEQMSAALADFDRFRVQAEEFMPWLGAKVLAARTYLDG